VTLPAAVVVNPRRAGDLDRFRRECAQAAAARGWAPQFLLTRPDDAGAGLARAALAAGARLVVAAGGDGTVRACAQVLAGTDVPLAIVPTGTGNLAARALGLPQRPGAALAVAFGGAQRRIDVAAADGTPYLVMAGIGLDAAVVGATPQWLKERAGWLAYAATGAVRLPGRRHEFTVRLDGGPPLTRRARCVVVGNAGLLPGGFTLLPRAHLDDGLLDVGILAPGGPVGWAVVAGRVIVHSGRGDDHRLERFTARRVEIAADTVLPRHADGEVRRPGRELVVEVASISLWVRVPLSGRQPQKDTGSCTR
jgi:diacylglycerol kinase (ATP)